MSAWNAGEIIANMMTWAINQLKDSGDGVAKIMAGQDTGSIGNLGAITNELTGVIQSEVIPAAQAVGYAIAITFFIFALANMLTGDRLTVEQFIKFFAKLGVGIFIVSVSDELFRACLDFGDGISTLFSASFPSASITVPDDLSNQINEVVGKGLGNFIKAIIMSFISILPCVVASLAIKVLVYVIAFTRLIELCARGCFIPIAAGLVSDDGWRGAGGRYFRKFLAICSQSAILVVIGKIASYALGTIGNSILTNLPSLVTAGTMGILNIGGQLAIMIAIRIAMESVMFKSIGIVNDAFGA